MTKRPLLTVMLIVGAVFLALAIRHRYAPAAEHPVTDSRPDRSPALVVPKAAAVAVMGKHAVQAAVEQDAEWVLPNSLIGTSPDGEIELDAQGRLKPGLGLRRLFDYFLSTMGELDLAAIRKMLLAHVDRFHDADVVAAVAGLFDRYVDYQRARSDHVRADTDAALRFANEKILRRQLFDAETVAAFFGEEEAYLAFTLVRMTALQDPRLGESERRERVDQAMSALTPEQRMSMLDSTLGMLAEEQSRQFESMGVDPQTRLAERSADYGTAAAHNLALLDQQRLEWDQRVAAYRAARDTIRMGPQVGAAERERQIAELRRRSFDEAGARRIIALETIGQL